MRVTSKNGQLTVEAIIVIEHATNNRQRVDGLHVLPSQARLERDVLATYHVTVSRETDVYRMAESFAIGQTLGTWVAVPGVTDEMNRQHRGRVVAILASPPVDLITQRPDRMSYLIQLALPSINFGADLAQLLTTVIGNDASTSIQAKLVDLQIPRELAEQLQGPRFGIPGVRELVGVWDRPLTLNMIKPCTGLSPQQGAEIFYRTALGGVDLIKDDELLGNPQFSPVVERVKAFGEAAKRAADQTGTTTIYVPNVTAQGTALLENAERAVDAGARAVMVAYGSVGYGMVAELAGRIAVPILGHYAGSAPLYEGTESGMSAGLAMGTFPRLAGADLVMLNTPYGGYPMTRASYLEVAHRAALPSPGLKQAMPMAGGGVHPGVVERYVAELGPDIVLAAGGAIQGHPLGAAAGGRALRQAIDATMAGVPTDEYSTDHPELAAALAAFGYQPPEWER
jgi:2,3-diketo-5-methylthiopentyl-1-phosphate enolase